LRLIIVFVLVQATSDCSTSIDVFRGLGFRQEDPQQPGARGRRGH